MKNTSKCWAFTLYMCRQYFFLANSILWHYVWHTKTVCLCISKLPLFCGNSAIPSAPARCWEISNCQYCSHNTVMVQECYCYKFNV